MSAGYVRSNLLVLNGGASGDAASARESARRLETAPRGAPGSGKGQSGPAAAMRSRPQRKLNLEARGKGYEGEACGDCGNFTLVRNGTCMKCVTCGATSGCS